MNYLQKNLSHLGLSNNQIKIYIYLLYNKNKNISTLINETGINRKTVYQELEYMKSKGWLTKTHKWSTVSPNIILKQLEINNYQRLQDQKLLQNEIHDWEYLWNQNKVDSDIAIYTGRDQIMVLQEQILHEINCNILTYGETSLLEEVFGLDYVINWTQRRSAKNIYVKVISSQSPFSLKIKERDSDYNRETKIMPFEYKTRSVFSIYALDKMMIFEPVKNQLIVIHNYDIVHLFRNIFETAWNSLE